VYIKDIAEELGVHPRAVSRAIERSGSPSGRRPAARGSKLDAYKPMVDQLLGQGVWNARVIFREIQAAGNQGGESILRAYIHPKRPMRAARATVRFETAPGHQLQNDWAELPTVVGGREQQVHCAVNTLGYSRRFHFVAMECEDAEHTYESLILLSFEYFGGVTAEVLVDNQADRGYQPSPRCGGGIQSTLPGSGGTLWLPAACLQASSRPDQRQRRADGALHQGEFLRPLS
jgi:transposase